MEKIIGIWIAAFLTLCIYSFLYRDNPFYRFAEYLFVGVSLGYSIVLNIHQGLYPIRVAAFLGSADRGLTHRSHKVDSYRHRLVVFRRIVAAADMDDSVPQCYSYRRDLGCCDPECATSKYF